MNRKEFLRKLVFSLPAAAALQIPFGACRDDTVYFETDTVSPRLSGVVLVIGGGIAGIAAARSLKSVGLEPLILEAGYKLGGRIKTEVRNGMVMEYGASTIYGSSTNPVTQIARDAGVTLLNITNDDSYIYDQNGTLVTNEKMNGYRENFSTIMQQIKLSSSPIESVADMLARMGIKYADDYLLRLLFSTQLEMKAGASIDKLSSVYCDDTEKFSGEDLVAINGFDKIVSHLGSGLNVVLNCEVRGINYKGSKINVATNRGEYTAKHVLITVPLGVLQTQKITFDPPLPSEKSEAIKRLRMSANEKSFMRFGSSAYQHPAYALAVASAQPGKFNSFLNMGKYDSNNAFTSNLVGNYGEILGGGSGYDYANWALENFWKIFTAPKHFPSNYYGTQWRRDPFTYGAFSYVPVGAHASDYDVIAGDVDKKLFFAGEHTIRQYRGTVHGAYLSGLRAAEKIASSFS